MFTKENNNDQLPRTPSAREAKESRGTEQTGFSTGKTPYAPRKGLQRADSQNTRYMNMLLALDGIPRLHNLLAAFFTWILLAGFVLLPGTFTNLQNKGTNADEKALIDAVQHVPLFVIAFICSGIGVLGMLWLWWRWSRNYIWLNNRIFLPGALNSLAGIISTLVNVYSAQHGEFVETSKITITVTVLAAVICGGLTMFYSMVMLRNVKEAHNRQVGREQAGKHGEGIVVRMKRKAKEIQPEAGIV
ncbi:hypothetical protein C8R45DRAFT_839060 [Mycena sanguinolenta]|nr:hypothetical protein C8R45DRAFT_839060 [Mycena sanguinolenta]